MICRLSCNLLLTITALTLQFLVITPAYPTEISDALLQEYLSAAARPFTIAAGLETWTAVQPNGRSCTTCHGESLFTAGSHERTGKLIEPMAPSVNSERLTSRRKINKWFLRNCKWTFGRECTVQEKGDILFWLSQQ
ncbi:MAG: DUF1924 domain-containing protein [Proteobacteria bacterium]|nr:DUF1924 domain-containing protein [Pseudomonadota bacterium]